MADLHSSRHSCGRSAAPMDERHPALGSLERPRASRHDQGSARVVSCEFRSRQITGTTRAYKLRAAGSSCVSEKLKSAEFKFVEGGTEETDSGLVDSSNPQPFKQSPSLKDLRSRVAGWTRRSYPIFPKSVDRFRTRCHAHLHPLLHYHQSRFFHISALARSQGTSARCGF